MYHKKIIDLRNITIKIIFIYGSHIFLYTVSYQCRIYDLRCLTCNLDNKGYSTCTVCLRAFHYTQL